MPASNHFGPGIDAERYSRARPHIHDAAIGKFRAFAGAGAPFSRALDVGCGTGQSTVALTAIADVVIGVDPSADMLAHAVSHPRVSYRRAPAEDIPFPDGQYDVITAAQAFHWFDAEAFLAEASRLLRSPGWLVIYTSWFTGEMVEEATFAPWFRQTFLVQYPTPARNRTAITNTLAQAHSLTLRADDTFSNDLEMSSEAFIDYELSTTNVIAAVERGHSSFGEAAVWMRESLGLFFGDHPQRTFRFAGSIWYLKKQTA